MTSLWAIRILFLSLCIMAGYAISQVRPEFTGLAHSEIIGMAIGFGFVAILRHLRTVTLRKERGSALDHEVGRERLPVLATFVQLKFELRENRHDEEIAVEVIHRPSITAIWKSQSAAFASR